MININTLHSIQHITIARRENIERNVPEKKETLCNQDCAIKTVQGVTTTQVLQINSTQAYTTDQFKYSENFRSLHPGKSRRSESIF